MSADTRRVIPLTNTIRSARWLLNCAAALAMFVLPAIAGAVPTPPGSNGPIIARDYTAPVDDNFFVINQAGEARALSEDPDRACPTPASGGTLMAEGLWDGGIQVRYLNGVLVRTTPSPIAYTPLEFTPDQSALVFQYYQDQNTEIGSVPTAGGLVTDLSNTPSTDEAGPSVSPNGQKLAAGALDQITLNGMIETANLNGSGWASISNFGGFVSPVWSADGTKLVWGGGRVYRADATRANFANLAPEDNNPDTAPRYAPSGSKIAFVHQHALIVMNNDGSNQHTVSGPDAYSQTYTWSPDSQKLAYVDANDGTLYTVEQDGTNLTPVFSGFGQYLVRCIAWAPASGDTAAPTASIDASASPMISFSSNEAGSGFDCRIDGGTPHPCTSPQNFTFWTGTHSISVRAIDRSGNIGSWTPPANFTGSGGPGPGPTPTPPPPRDSPISPRNPSTSSPKCKKKHRRSAHRKRCKHKKHHH